VTGLARIRHRPERPSEQAIPGLHPIGLGDQRDGLCFVPSMYTPDRAWPLVVMLHGAGSVGRRGINPYLERAEELGIILLAPDSRGRTWDVIHGSWGPDVAFIDRALGELFGRCRIEPEQIVVEGFSDGASYALSLGLSNGDLFRRIVAFSPGFVVSGSTIGEPAIFVTHGVNDAVLPINRCSRRIVPKLQREGYDVEYREFSGGHEISGELIDASLVWMGLAL
jgi:phospholipase/carboxylesterase